jgi:hypothetical protein
MCTVLYGTFYCKTIVNHLEVMMGTEPNDSLIHPIADQIAIQRGVAIRAMSQPGRIQRSMLCLPLADRREFA